MDNNFNRVQLCGTVDSAPALIHVNHGVSFYKFTLAVERLSGLADKLTVIAAQPLLESAAIREGDTVTVRGQLRSFNNKSGQGSRLVISVFAHALEKGGDTPFNLIQLSGILCKPPVLRRTPLGRDQRHHSGGEPPVRAGRLSALHRLGRGGPAGGGHDHRRPPDHRGPGAEPYIHENRGRRLHGAHRLRGVHHAARPAGGVPVLT